MEIKLHGVVLFCSSGNLELIHLSLSKTIRVCIPFVCPICCGHGPLALSLFWPFYMASKLSAEEKHLPWPGQQNLQCHLTRAYCIVFLGPSHIPSLGWLSPSLGRSHPCVLPLLALSNLTTDVHFTRVLLSFTLSLLSNNLHGLSPHGYTAS